MLAASSSLANPMRKPVAIDANHGRAIAAEIGERLPPRVAAEKELPPALLSLLDRLQASEHKAACR